MFEKFIEDLKLIVEKNPEHYKDIINLINVYDRKFKCPNCGKFDLVDLGCLTCTNCGWSKCDL